jgi:hypothetical protein
MTATVPGNQPAFNLLEQDIHGLERSYITTELAEQAGIFRVDAVEGAQLIGRNGKGDYSGIVLPYVLPGESSPREYRLRRDHPDLELQSDGSLKEKAKYLSPPGRGNMLYFMPRTPAEGLRDATLPICLTEGEKKTIALYRLSLHNVEKNRPRFLAMGLPGVWNWRGVIGKTTEASGERRDVKGTIADLELINWQGRKVFIIFDANVKTNSSVRIARERLANELRNRGAIVYFVEIPEEPCVNGVDDLLAIKGAEYVLGLIDAARPAIEAKELRPSVRSQLLNITEGLELFHSEGEGFVAIYINDHKETYALRSKAFKQYLSAKMYEIEGKGASAQSLQEVLETLQGRALFSGVERPTFRRIAEANGKIYVDLCNSNWQAIEITAEGWQVTTNYPVTFLRSKGMLPLPIPEKGGSLDDLREFINVGSDEDFALIKAWLVQTVRFDVPFALLALGGEQGSAKSTTATILRSLIDPNTAQLRRPPKDERDLIAAARNGWIIALNNLSSIPAWLSDALCCLAVDGGFAARELYTDGDEFILKARRPIILTSIEDIIGKSDLLDRTVSITLPPIPGHKRENERNLWRRFHHALPKLLGALCDAASIAIRNLPNTKIINLPRMADFAEWAVASEGKTEQMSICLRAYRAMRQTNNQSFLEASPVAAVLQRFIEREKAWSGTASELLAEFDDLATEKEKKRRSYPKAPNTLSNKLREIAPNIRQNGIEIRLGDRKGRKGVKIIHIETIEKSSSESPASSEGEMLTPTNRLSNKDLEADDRQTMADDELTIEGEASSASYSQQYQDLSRSMDGSDDADDVFPIFSNDNESQFSISVPFMITRKMRSQLLQKGYVDFEIDKMTPEYAWQVLEDV